MDFDAQLLKVCVTYFGYDMKFHDIEKTPLDVWEVDYKRGDTDYINQTHAKLEEVLGLGYEMYDGDTHASWLVGELIMLKRTEYFRIQVGHIYHTLSTVNLKGVIYVISGYSIGGYNRVYRSASGLTK